MDGDYPRMLYRPGEMIQWEGRDLDHHIVHSEDEELEALEEGWRRHDQLDERPAEKPKQEHKAPTAKRGRKPRAAAEPAKAEPEKPETEAAPEPAPADPPEAD